MEFVITPRSALTEVSSYVGQLRRMREEGLEGPAEWLSQELDRETRACPWRSCNRLEDHPQPSLEPDVKADEVVQLLDADAEVRTGKPCSVCAVANLNVASGLAQAGVVVVEGSDAGAEALANAADTNGKESEEDKQ